MAQKSLVLLGATGFVGCYVTELLAQKHPEFEVTTILRSVTPERTSILRSLDPNISILEGDLEDRELVSNTAEKADVVIHVAHSDHEPSVSAVLEGLTRRAQAARKAGGEPPIYLHMSGCGIVADNVRGEYRAPETIKEWSDLDLDLNECPSGNTHLPTDKAILAAGTRKEDPIRTIIVFPSLIYGMGKTERCGMWLPIFAEFARKCEHAGTWGPGEVTQYAIHVRDVASAVLFLLEAALDGRVKGGEDGLCEYQACDATGGADSELMEIVVFATTKEPNMTWKEINDVLGEVLWKRGEIKEPYSKPFPPEITEPLGHCEYFFPNRVPDKSLITARWMVSSSQQWLRAVRQTHGNGLGACMD